MLHINHALCRCLSPPLLDYASLLPCLLDAIVHLLSDTIRTLIYTGRPLRIKKGKFVMDWENNRQEDIKRLCAKGQLPYQVLLLYSSAARHDNNNTDKHR